MDLRKGNATEYMGPKTKRLDVWLSTFLTSANSNRRFVNTTYVNIHQTSFFCSSDL